MTDSYEEMAVTEDSLEPVELVRQSGAVARIGKMMLGAGTASYRVKQAMNRAALAMRLDKLETTVTLTEVMATSFRGRIFRTEVAQVDALGVNADRINDLDRLARDLPMGTTARELWDKLDAIAAKHHLYPVVVNALAAGLACAAFTFLNNGGLVDCLTVLIAAWLGQGVRAFMLRRHLNQFISAMVSAGLATLVYIGILTAMNALHLPMAGHEAGYIASVLFLIPGFPLVTAGLDLAKLDFTAGVSRIAYALMILMSAGMAVWAVTLAFDLTPSPIPVTTIPVGWLVVLRLVASFAGVFGFAIMFNTPWRMAVVAAIIGMIANTARLEVVDLGMNKQAATVLAALLVGVLASATWPRFGIPRIILTVPAVLVMVPGASAYRAIVLLNAHEVSAAVSNGIDATFLMVAIMVGLGLARVLTDRSWAFDR